MKRHEAILDYWFGSGSGLGLWFGGDAETDREIRERFSGDLEQAVQGKLGAWERGPDSALALIILLDQFSLQLHREEARSFDQSAAAIPIALRVIERGFDRQLDTARRAFLYMPFMHAEDLELQERGVALFERLAREAGPGERELARSFHEHAILHRDVVKRYGRFPGRNAAYGRVSTAEEKKYLEDGGEF